MLNPWSVSFAYSTDLANLLTAQLTKFTTLNRHQLAGHVANLDFWLAEAQHCLNVLDGYRARFERMKSAQAEFVATNRARLGDVHNPFQTKGAIFKPHSLPDDEQATSRHELCQTCYRFLLRCFREGLLDELRLRQTCEQLDIGVESRDLTLR